MKRMAMVFCMALFLSPLFARELSVAGTLGFGGFFQTSADTIGLATKNALFIQNGRFLGELSLVNGSSTDIAPASAWARYHINLDLGFDLAFNKTFSLLVKAGPSLLVLRETTDAVRSRHDFGANVYLSPTLRFSEWWGIFLEVGSQFYLSGEMDHQCYLGFHFSQGL